MAATTTIMATTLVPKAQRPPMMAAFPTNRALFGLKGGVRGGRAMAYKLTLITPEGTKVVDCPADTFILDAAEDAGLNLPYTCRTGACSSCVGKVKSGTIDQSDQSFLDDDQVDAGYVLTCVAYATSNVTLETHKEDDLADES